MHDLRGGVEYFRSQHTGGNSQSATDYVFQTDYLQSGGKPAYDSQGVPIPVWTHARPVSWAELVGHGRGRAQHQHDILVSAGPLDRDSAAVRRPWHALRGRPQQRDGRYRHREHVHDRAAVTTYGARARRSYRPLTATTPGSTATGSSA
jgi:hypothetical protein